jgi:hypothetical protein
MVLRMRNGVEKDVAEKEKRNRKDTSEKDEHIEEDVVEK